MNKIRYKYYDIIYPLILLLIVLLIIYQYLFTGVIHCDGNTNDIAIFEPLTWDYPSQESLPKSDLHNNSNPSTIYSVLLEDQDIKINCFTAYTKYKEISRRKLYWYSCIKSKSTFNSYDNFKESWDPNTRVIHEIKKELNKDIKNELHKIHLAKRTLDWIFKPGSRGSRGG